jgi:hypothetical protein
VAITPDTKDWTWVLVRPCPECGFDPDAYPRAAFAQRIRDNALVWHAVLYRADVRRRPRADVWSPLEYGCHVRDVYRIMDGRLALMLEQDNPTFANWDQDETARADAYEEQDPAEVGVELVGAATDLARRIDGVSGEQWLRPGTRSNGSEFTVESLIRYALHDVVHHLVDLPSV